MNFVTANELGKIVSDLKKENKKLKEWNTKYKKALKIKASGTK